MLKEERELREWFRVHYGMAHAPRRNKFITAFRRAIYEDVCQQVSDAINQFPKNTRVKLMDTIMRYEKPKAAKIKEGE